MQRRSLVVFLLLCFILSGCSMSDGKAKQVQQGMTKYLKSTYNKEFVVQEPYLTGNEGEGYFYQAKAYPKGKPELEFFVEGDKYNSGPYIDGYLQVLWTYQGKQKLEKALRQVYGDSFYIDNYEFRYNQKKFKDLNYPEVIGKCNGNATIFLAYYIFSDQFNKEIEAEKAYKIMKPFLLDYGINKYNITVLYFTKGFEDEFKLNGNDYGQDKDGERKTYDMLHREKKLTNAFLTYHLKDTHPIKVEKSRDLIRWFKY